MKSIAIVVMLGLLGSACTTGVAVHQLPRAASAAAASADRLPVGFVYNLPAARVTPSGALTLGACEVDREGDALLERGGSDDHPPPLGTALFAVSGRIGVDYVAGERVVVDYRHLAAFMKTATLAIERYPNGMLKSVNASIADESADTLAAGLAAAGSIAVLAGTGGAGAGLGLAPRAMARSSGPGFAPRYVAPPVDVDYVACSADALAMLTERAARVKAAQALAGAREASVAAVRALVARPRLADADRRALEALRARLAEQSEAIAAALGAVATLDARLTLAIPAPERTNWTAMDSPGGEAIAPDTAATDAFMAAMFVPAHGQVRAGDEARFGTRPCTRQPASGCANLDALRALVLAEATLVARLHPIDADADPAMGDRSPRLGSDYEPGARGLTTPGDGLIYVDPARERIVLSAAGIDPTRGLVPGAQTLASIEASIPQRGTFIALPLHAGFGQKTSLAATFAPDGTLETAQYAKPVSAGRAVATAASGAAAQVQASEDAVQAKRVKAATDAAAIADARKTVSADALAVAQDADAQAALAAARAKLAAAPPS